LNDEAHAALLDKLAEKNFVGASPGVKAELMQFFADPGAAYATKRHAKAWAKVQIQLQQLKSAPGRPSWRILHGKPRLPHPSLITCSCPISLIAHEINLSVHRKNCSSITPRL
jgi:hypothetical protein